jgi:GDP-L-fucose synthase
MNLNSRIYIAGHTGLVGSNLYSELTSQGYSNIIVRTRSELDLTDHYQVKDFFRSTQPDYVFLCAARVGGIIANSTYPVEFLQENLAIQSNIISNAHRFNTAKLLFLGSSCIYPRACPQPIFEEYLLTGPLEPTNEPYALAKIAGIKLCQAYSRQHHCNFISAMPTNLYGNGDNYTDPNNAHVIPALFHKFSKAILRGDQSITLLGSGKPLREFLHVKDLARALIHLMKFYNDPAIINVGSGHELSIRDLAHLIASISGFTGRIDWDTSQPDGTPRKFLNSDKIKSIGWEPTISLHEGLANAYRDFLNPPPPPSYPCRYPSCPNSTRQSFCEIHNS